MRRIATAVVVLGLMAASAAADDMYDPPWDMTLPGATYQVWDFTMEPDGPFIVENPFGDPMIEWPAFVNYEELIGPDGTPVGAWHIGGEPGTTSPVTVWVPNNPDENEVKMIQWQVTATGSPTAGGNLPGVTVPGPTGGPVDPSGGVTHPPHPHGSIQRPNGWYQYAGYIEVRPNPKGEWITFEFAQCKHIEQIVIHSLCTPEPATLGLLAAGGLLTLVRRKRR